MDEFAAAQPKGFEVDSTAYGSQSTEQDSTPEFTLGRVQYQLSSNLAFLQCASNQLVLAQSDRSQITRIDLANPAGEIIIPLASNPSKLFTHPAGNLSIVTLASSESYYVTGNKLKPLNKLKNIAVSAVCWLPDTTSTAAHLLLGDAKGKIYDCSFEVETDANSDRGPSVNRLLGGNQSLATLWTLPSAEPITGIVIRQDTPPPRAKSRSKPFKKPAFVIATTPSRILQFAGKPLEGSESQYTIYESLFKLYRDTSPKSLELPSELSYSELHAWTTSADTPETSTRIAWLTNPGIYYGTVTTSTAEIGESILESSQLVPYPVSSSSTIPVSMALLEWHFILLYQDSVKIVRLLDDRVVFEETLDLRHGEKALRISVDEISKTYWIYTDRSKFELVIKDEAAAIWQVYLQRGNHSKALSLAKTPSQKSIVHTAQADSLFAAGKYMQAAKEYASAGPAAFSDVVLKFVDRGMVERDALRWYLVCILEGLPKTDVMQRMMLATWLVEIYLAKIDQLEDMAASEAPTDSGDAVGNLEAEKSIMEDDLRAFLATWKDSLDKKTIFDLIASHGRSEMLLHFATLVGDWEWIMKYWVAQEQWNKALDVLNRQNSDELYYSYAPPLMRQLPKDTINTLTRRISLDPKKLLPALLPITPNEQHVQQSLRYLHHVTADGSCSDSSIYNALIHLHILSKSEQSLLDFLERAPEDIETSLPYYDLDYALRVCTTAGFTNCCSFIYAKMGLHESAVELALKAGDLVLAKRAADGPDDETIKKKLWMKVAEHVVKDKNDMKAAMDFIESTPLLKIEDILPFFPDFAIIDDFKDSICEALESYSDRIDKLNQDMEDATRSAELIEKDINELKNRFVVVDAAEKCTECELPLLTRQFYVFPCGHSFHADCLISEVTKHMSSFRLRRILELQNQISRPPTTTKETPTERDNLGLASGRKLALASVQGLDSLRKLVIPDALVGKLAPSNYRTSISGPSNPTAAVERWKKELDDLLAKSCVLCDTAIDSIDKGFLMEGEFEI